MKKLQKEMEIPSGKISGGKIHGENVADYKTNLNYKSSGWFFCAIYTKMEKRERGVKG